MPAESGGGSRTVQSGASEFVASNARKPSALVVVDSIGVSAMGEEEL